MTHVATFRAENSAFWWQATKAGFSYLRCSETEIECLAISPDGEEQLAASSGGTITVWTYQGIKYLLLSLHR